MRRQRALHWATRSGEPISAWFTFARSDESTVIGSFCSGKTAASASTTRHQQHTNSGWKASIVLGSRCTNNKQPPAHALCDTGTFARSLARLRPTTDCWHSGRLARLRLSACGARLRWSFISSAAGSELSAWAAERVACAPAPPSAGKDVYSISICAERCAHTRGWMRAVRAPLAQTLNIMSCLQHVKL